MNGKLIIAILVIAAVPVCAQAQKPSAATVTKTDVSKGRQIDQWRQGEDPDLLRYRQAQQTYGGG